MKKSSYVIGAFIVALLIGLLFFATAESNKIKLVEFDDIASLVQEYNGEKSKDFLFLYNGEIDKSIKDYSKHIKKNNRIMTYQVKLTEEELEKLSTDDIKIENNGYIVYVEGELMGFISNSLDETKKDELVKKYLYGYIPVEERYYQVLSTADEYIKKFNSNEYTVAVFGASSCTFCTKYLPIVNEVAKKYNLNIYYFDKDTYDSNEYEKVMDLDYTIPGTCTQSGEETTLGSKFDKPLTVITKKGNLVGCIKGYVNEDTLVEKLIETKVIKGVKN